MAPRRPAMFSRSMVHAGTGQHGAQNRHGACKAKSLRPLRLGALERRMGYPDCEEIIELGCRTPSVDWNKLVPGMRQRAQHDVASATPD